MKRLQAFKFQLKPNGQQKHDMLRFAGSCRFAFNKALASQKENYEAGHAYIPYNRMASWLIQWKANAQLQWLKDVPAQALQQSLKDLERAYLRFFQKQTAFPKFKKRGAHDAFRYPQGVKLEQAHSRLYFPKLGWVRYRNSQEVLGVVRNATVSQSCGKWYVSLQTEREVQAPVSVAKSAVGIDLGITRFATFSDASFLAPLNSFKKHQIRLARYQRRMNRKVKFSCNWRKAKTSVQKIHTRIAHARRDFLHKATTTISQNHTLVCIEDLQVRNMSRSSKGICEQPGKYVVQKSGLNRSILDQGWAEFRRQLSYKLVWRGGILIAVPPQNTSRTCPHCKHVSKDNRSTQAQFLCVACGYMNHADVVGAINILERGHRLIACGEAVQLDPSAKQEPIEVARQELSLV